MIEPDYGENLQDLYNQWYTCEKCELSIRRKEANGNFVFGEGFLNGIMFVGEGPGATEEEEGRPFVGSSGQVLRSAIAAMNLTDFYITNTVCCRCCKQAYNSEGQPMLFTRKNGEQYPIIKDEPPSSTQIAACYQRLCGEIYHVDPVIIVALGLEAAKALSSIRISSLKQARSETKEAHIPGKFSVPARTTVRQMWERKIKGKIVRPTNRFMVRYKLIVTYHPSYIMRFKEDRKPDNPVEVFARDLRMAAMIYDRYMMMAKGIIPSEREINSEFIREVMQ